MNRTITLKIRIKQNPYKYIALIGVDDLCIVDTPDALLVAKRTGVEKVKNILQQIRDTGKIEVL